MAWHGGVRIVAQDCRVRAGTALTKVKRLAVNIPQPLALTMCLLAVADVGRRSLHARTESLWTMGSRRDIRPLRGFSVSNVGKSRQSPQVRSRARGEQRCVGGPVQGAWRRSPARLAPRTMVRARPPARMARVTVSLEWMGWGVPLTSVGKSASVLASALASLGVLKPGFGYW